MVDYQRTHTCGALRKNDVGSEIRLSGWVHRRRDHGGLIFIDLRDRYGLTQIVFRPTDHPEFHEKASHLRGEWVISVKGKVIPRAEGMINPSLKTGEIEIEVLEFAILSQAKTPPFSICDENITVNEELRLKYRYLDIRRGDVTKRLLVRHRAMLLTRNYLDKQGFTEITTPILGKSSPEGARDYLIPSRIYPGSFYALPQAPQIFKQLLMISGMDRYFQIATCFRDEDLRADRQPEFTQIDLEMSFGTQETLFPILEGLMIEIFNNCKGIKSTSPFRHMTYHDAMDKYGTDKPDLRFGMEFHDLSDIAEKSTFSIFLDELKRGNKVKGFCVKGGTDISRKMIDEHTLLVKKFGLQGLAWIKLKESGPTSTITKFFEEPLLDSLIKRVGAETGDLIFLASAPDKILCQSLDHLRRHLANKRNLIDPTRFEFLWITDFPLFQWDAESQSLACEHNPFTSPHPDDIHLLDTDPLSARSAAYDLVLNGYEVASGACRIYDSALQDKIFTLLKLTPEEINERFGFFIEALKYGTPPHLGLAFGFDRLMMILTETDNIRDVIAFPKNQQAADLMMSAPSEAQKEQLTELKIHIHDQEETK
ncbi:MAG: Aspartate--tRNA(Asp/Asn) ligase [Chlamydiae bacterium]|nr:Aspartate--tRNA(Asp/Asn) ligase [Chlamydiota bacterium]